MILFDDLRFAFRSLLNNPGFALSAILALALGIGSNSAIFSILDAVLLRPLPFPQSERLVNVWESNQTRNIPRMIVAPGNYQDWRAQSHVFSNIGSYQTDTFTLSASTNDPERFSAAICDKGFFDTLRINPILGRVFADEEILPGRDGVVIIGYGVWQQRFGGDPKIVGQTLNLDGRTRTVIGVMPSAFEYPAKAVMWEPLGFDKPMATRRDYHRLRVIARLKDGATLQQARAEFEMIGAHLAAQYPEMNKGETVIVNPVLEDLVGPIRPVLLVLVCAVVFVLLIACANVANLLLVRTAFREREVAIRTSLGAPRARIVRQLLTESILLAGLGGLAGLILAYGAFRALLSFVPPSVPRMNQVHLDWRVIAFTLGASLLTGILFGFAPAWRISKANVNAVLKTGTRGSTGRSPLRSALVVSQVAAALILLAGAGLLMRSFYNIAHLDAGFNPEHVMTMRIAPAPYKYRDHADLQIELARSIRRNVAALPGVVSAGVSTDLPLLPSPHYIMRFEGRPPVQVSQAPIANYFAVTPGFFETMGMHLVRGRDFSMRESPATPPVAIVNQTLVNRYFPGQDPIGKRLEVAFRNPPEWREIIGVVADVRTQGLDQDTPVQVYVDYLQIPALLSIFTPPVAVLARTRQDPAAVAAGMKAAILNVDRGQPVYAIQPMTDVVSQSIAQRRVSLVLLGFFALSALFLASLGLYGVISYSVAQRTREVGIRMALGARPGNVLLLIERQGMSLVLIGLAVGLAVAFLLTRLMSSLLFQVSAADPVTFAAVPLVLAGVAFVACYLPARRAAKVDPMVALRDE